MKNLIAAMSASPDGFALINEKGSVVSWNYAMERITGLRPFSALGKPIWEVQAYLFPNLYGDASYLATAKSFWAEDKSKALTKLWPDPIEEVLRKGDGKTQTVNINYHFFAQAKNLLRLRHKIFLAITIKDLSPQKQKETALEQIIGSTFHDLRSPLNAILGFSDVIIDDIDTLPNELIINYLNLIRDSGNHLLNIVECSLLFDKIEKKGISLNKESIELDSFLEKILHSFPQIGRPRGVEFGIICLLSKNEHFFAHETLLRSSIENLLKNAAEASPTGKKILLKISKDKNSVNFEIKNEGEIPMDVRNRLFQKFASSGKKDGNGIGLYKAKLIIEAHGGKISYQSSNGFTSFTIQLPL